MVLRVKANLNAGIDGSPSIDKQFLPQAHKLRLLSAVQERDKLCTSMRAGRMLGVHGCCSFLGELSPFGWAGGPFSFIVLTEDKSRLKIEGQQCFQTLTKEAYSPCDHHS